MDDTEVERENAEKVEIDVTLGGQDLINNEEFQQGENKQQEQMYLECQNSSKEEKDINIVTSHQLMGRNGLENFGGQSDILGEETSNKHTMENQKVFGENFIGKEKNLDKVEPIIPNTNDAFKDQSGTAGDIKMIEEEETGTPEDQAAFMKELESFYKEKGMDFRPPKFYGKILNCLKLYRAVIRLGGYDRVTGAKFWRQIGESFHPPKTCTTVSYAFRIFYEKALLEYERHKLQNGELQLDLPSVPEPVAVANVPTGSGRARRDAAARAMQGWHAQRHYGYGEISEPIIKDKSLNNMVKREKNLKNIGSVKNKRPKEVEHPVKAARTQSESNQLVGTVVDVGPPADWVKITVLESKDCFEVYALVPGLLREEVRVQSDPEGRLVITGQPEHLENPWGITAFKKVVSLPARIDPLQTSAVVSLHGRLFVRLPFDTSM